MYNKLPEDIFVSYEPNDFDDPKGVRCERLRFPRLASLQAGGKISRDKMLALLHMPESMRDLSFIALQDGESAQENGPGGLLFLSPIQ